MMQQILAAQQIPARLVDQGAIAYFGWGSPTAIQVRVADQWAARLLLSPLDAEPEADSDEATETPE